MLDLDHRVIAAPRSALRGLTTATAMVSVVLVVVLVLLAAGTSTASPARAAAAEDYTYEDGDDEYSSSGEEDDDEEAEDKDADDALLRRGRRVQHLDVADKLAAGFEPQDEARCPPPPPRRPSQCWAPRCATDSDCSSSTAAGHQHRCCSNGCVSTCVRTADPPLVVDWEEETPDALHPDAAAAPAPPMVPAVVAAPRRAPRPPPHLPAVAEALAAPEVVALMGGCTLHGAELRRLQDFRRGAHVRRCFCSNGAILCRVG